MLFGIEWSARGSIDAEYLYHGSDPTREPRLHSTGGNETYESQTEHPARQYNCMFFLWFLMLTVLDDLK